MAYPVEMTHSLGLGALHPPGLPAAAIFGGRGHRRPQLGVRLPIRKKRTPVVGLVDSY